MLTSERQRLLHEHAIKTGEVSIADMAKKFNVSIETIRRDINILCQKNLLKKVHGGAISMQAHIREDSYDIRRTQRTSEKLAICSYIAENMIQDNDSIALASGSTMEMLADIITGQNLFIVTNSINVATILQNRMRREALSGELILLGGELHSNERYTNGLITMELLQKFTFSKTFFSASAICGDQLMNSNVHEGYVISTMIKNSQFCCLAADGRKLDMRSTYTFAHLGDIDAMVTDEEATVSEDLRSALDANEVELYQAPAK